MEVALDFGASSIKSVVGTRYGILDYDLGQLTRFARSLPKGCRLKVTGGNKRILRKYLKGACFVDERSAIGYGGLQLAGKKKATVISVGTGTCVVEADRKGVIHKGGTGLGGGTLEGLGKQLGFSLKALDRMALRGNAENVNLTVKDIIGGPLGRVLPKATASSFYQKASRKPDIAAGLVRMVADAVLSIALHTKSRPIIVTGRTTELASFRKALKKSASSIKLNIIIPKKATFATAVGAQRW